MFSAKNSNAGNSSADKLDSGFGSEAEVEVGPLG